jgi:DNA polymerase/3'-5' exonuclease PolX
VNLITAERYAEKLTTWLLPFCDRIQVAGSIRRGCQECGDVDLVVIPKFNLVRDMFGVIESRRNQLHKHLAGYVADPENGAKWLAGEQNPDGRNYLVQLKKCQLDIFCATHETWGTLLLCRTGSKEHNIWLADLVKRRGGHWNPYTYLRIGDTQHDVSTEESIYRAVGLDYITPRKREAGSLPC